MPGSRRITGLRIDGNLYIHHRDKGLYRLTENGPELYVPQATIGATNHSAILWADAQPQGWLLVTGDGLVRFQNGVGEPFAPEVSKILKEAFVTGGVHLSDGRYAFGTVNRGIVVMRANGELDELIDKESGLPAKYITSLFVDHDNDVWATSQSGVFRIDLTNSSRLFDERAGLQPQYFRAITRVGGDVIAANNLGVFSLSEGKTQFKEISPIATSLHDITPSLRGLILSGYRGAWCVQRDNTLLPLYRTEFDIQTALESKAHTGVTYLSEDAHPAILALSAGAVPRIAVSDIPSAVTSLAEDSDGMLFMGTSTKGVFIARIDATATSLPIPLSQAFSVPEIDGAAAVSGGPTGEVLIATPSAGWLKAPRADKFQPILNYPSTAQLPAFSFSADGNLWIVRPGSESSSAVVTEIKYQSNGPISIPHSIRGLEQIGNPTSIFAEIDVDGRTVLWIGGTKSILRHVVSAGETAIVPHTPILHAFARSGRGESNRLVASILPYSIGSVTFEFAEPDFALRPQLRLQTKIAGIDADWMPVSRDSRRELTALREGKYAFQVRAVAETGVASEPTVFQFEVAPPWWRTPTAAIAGILILIPIGYGLYRWRVQTLRNRNTELEHKVKERTEELEEANAAKTMFVANMSHDIRNPLNGIVGLALALEETKLDHKQREIIATLRECTTYLSSLVDDVLDFASIEAGKFELRAGPFVPADLLNSIVTTLRSEANQRSALITIETDPDLPPMLRGDAGRIQQILVNYLSNALKYAGGHIRLGVSVAADSPGEIEFFVADEGAGISEEEQKALFTKFSRLDGARRDNIKGTGLGLAACRLLADAMGGSVGVESRLGNGSRFILRLPLTIAVEPERVSQDVSLPQTSVLLVEDTDYNAMAAEAVLAKLGLKCDRARTGEEAIRMFGEKRHNVVLLDRNLPDMDGTDVARKMRELENDGLQSVLLAVTAYCTEEDRALCLKAGMDAFVGKPLTPEKLRRVLLDASRRILGAATIEAPVEAQPKPTANTPEFDTTLLEYIADDATGGVAGQAQRFISALTEAYAQLVGMQSTDDLNALGDAAHKVLGHARMVGAPALTDAATQLETAARAGDTDGIARAFPRVATAVTKLTEALRRRSGAQKV